MKINGSDRRRVLSAIFVFLFAMMAASCGTAKKPDLTPPGATNVNLTAAFGTQCPYGSIIDPVPTKMYMVDCGLPPSMKTANLTQAPQPLVLEGDCNAKVLSVRSQQRELIDSSWEVLPDNTFDFTINTGYAVMADDGYGHKNCLLPLAADIFGKMNCGADRDKMNIDFQVNWYVGTVDEKTGTISTAKPQSGQLFCQVAKGCYLNAAINIAQCP